jgi:wobble nucleotide-excising tRNase
MSERTHKRKRSLQDSTVDLSKMRMALTHLAALKDELDGIEETVEELHSISEHVVALENILKGAKKPVGQVNLYIINHYY